MPGLVNGIGILGVSDSVFLIKIPYRVSSERVDQCIHRLISAGVSIREKKDTKSQSFFEILVLGAQSTDLDVQTHF